MPNPASPKAYRIWRRRAYSGEEAAVKPVREQTFAKSGFFLERPGTLASVGWARYFDERVETMPSAWTRRLEEELLAEQLLLCWERAPFYRRKLSEAGIRPEHVQKLEDLRLLPFTTAEELRESQAAAPPFGDYVCAEPVEVARGVLALDEAGRPLLTAYTERDAEQSARVGARALWAAGARPDDTVLHCLSHGGGREGVCEHDALEATGATAVPLAPGETDRVLELWESLAPTAVLAARAFALDLAEAARRRGLEPGDLGLRMLFVTDGAGGGTTGELWGASVGDLYGLPEVWSTVAGGCEERDGLHFCGQGATLVELVGPDGDPVDVEPGAEGELVFTHLDREASPLLRYRSGDAVTVVGVECGCGRTGFRFRLAVRA
jgi:phenylacetate-CoA ligase